MGREGVAVAVEVLPKKMKVEVAVEEVEQNYWWEVEVEEVAHDSMEAVVEAEVHYLLEVTLVLSELFEVEVEEPWEILPFLLAEVVAEVQMKVRRKQVFWAVKEEL